jgi:RND family efflux transporter MFP subunit
MHAARSAGFVLAAILTVACGDGEAGNPRDSTGVAADSGSGGGSTLTLPVVGQPVIQGDLVLSVDAKGTIRSEASSALKAETGGTVLEVLVRPGDRVRRGQALVKLDTIPLGLALERARATVNNAEMNYVAEIAPDSLANNHRPPTPARRAFAMAKSGLETARVSLKEAELNLERSTIIAPYDGVIERVDVAAGERISSGEDVAMIIDLVNLRVDAAVFEHDLTLLRPGGEARITVSALPGEPITGRIAAVLPMVDSISKAGTAVVRIRGDGRLRPGMYVDIRLEANRLPNRIIVPTRAVIERDGRPLVFVVRDGIAEWVYIHAGRSNGRETEILADTATGIIPLKPGEMVLIEGHLTLTHQARVRLVAKSEENL